MLNAFLTFVNEHIPDLSGSQTLLAVSSGVDSMVLAELFYQAQFPFAIAHCNFGLRGEESDGDEQFIREWATEHQVEIHVRHLPALEKSEKEGISVQMAARDLRYHWFEELRNHLAFDYVATAHHINDAIETFLLNFTRGTGISGLSGIAITHQQLIRPLLFASRAEIEEFARVRQLRWREDSSNQSTYYRRNLLRQQVIPILQQINPSLEITSQRTFERLRAANTLLYAYLDTWQREVIRQEGDTIYLSIKIIQQAKEPAFQLHHILDAYKFSYAQSRQIVAALAAESGKVFYSPSHQLTKDRAELILTAVSNTTQAAHILVEKHTREIELPGSYFLTLERLNSYQTIAFLRNPKVAYIDDSRVTYPLTIRPWQQGDWFCPYGMKGKKKKVSDLLIDQKMPVSEKDNQLVLTDHSGQILWVVGIRSDERFGVQPASASIVRLEISTR